MIDSKKSVATSTLTIPLVNGRIEGKSGVNLQKLVDSMDTNLQRVLVNIVLEKIGMVIETDGSVLSTNEEKTLSYIAWLRKRAEFSNKFRTIKKYAIAEKL